MLCARVYEMGENHEETDRILSLGLRLWSAHRSHVLCFVMDGESKAITQSR